MSVDERTEETKAEGVPPSISQLISDYQARTGDSLHRASQRSASSGHTVTQRYLWDLKSGRAKGWPKSGATFVAIAEGIETTPLAVVLGFAVYHGVPVRMPSFATRLPPAIDDAPDNVQDAILAVAWAVSTEAPVRRFLADDAVPEIGPEEGLIGDPGTHGRPSEITEHG